MADKETLRAYVAWAIVCTAWGTTYLAIRIGVEVLPPALFAGGRFLIAGLLFLPVLLLRGAKLPARRHLMDIAIVGIALLTVANGLVVWAEQWVPSGLAALIVATLPFWMVGLQTLIPRGEGLTVRKVLGILIGFGGLILLLWPDLQGTLDRDYLKGVLGLCVAAVSWASGSLYSKYRNIKVQPLVAAALQMIVAGLVLIAVGLVRGEAAHFHLELQGLLALLYLIVFGSILGYSSYIYALAKLPASVVSTYAYLNPIVAVALGWLVLDERLDWRVAAATAIILFGVLLVNSARSARKPTPTVVEKPAAAETHRLRAIQATVSEP